MKRLELSVVLTAVFFSGCAPRNAPPLEVKPQAIDSPNSKEQFPRLRWKSIEADGNESLSMGSPVSANDKGIRIVEDKFHQLGWNNPLSKPSISVELADNRSLTIRLSANSTRDRLELIAVRREPDNKFGNTTTVAERRSHPLKDARQALALLRSYTKDDGEFESLVAWMAQDGSSSNKGD